jgi:uncharacterized protein with GYD domain
MATFVVLITETEQGESHIQQSVDRAAQFQAEAAHFGVTVKALYWTLGGYDGIVIIDAPDDETAAALIFRLTSKGNVSTQTLRGFDADEMRAILSRSSKG